MVLQAQEEERRRVARDLHDEVNQALTALLLRIEAMAQDAPPELQDGARRDQALANQAMGELLDLARQLRPTALDDHGLVAALRTHVRELRPARAGAGPASGPTRRSTICRPTSQVVDLPGRPGGAAQRGTALGREPHRRQPRASTTAASCCGSSDDGSGFAFAEEGKGLGLSGMRERALLVGGKLEIDSRPGKGTTVKLDVPIRTQQEPSGAEDRESAAALHGAGAT